VFGEKKCELLMLGRLKKSLE